jgi:hypothetical protein
MTRHDDIANIIPDDKLRAMIEPIIEMFAALRQRSDQYNAMLKPWGSNPRRSHQRSTGFPEQNTTGPRSTAGLH